MVDKFISLHICTDCSIVRNWIFSSQKKVLPSLKLTAKASSPPKNDGFQVRNLQTIPGGPYFQVPFVKFGMRDPGKIPSPNLNTTGIALKPNCGSARRPNLCQVFGREKKVVDKLIS